jgi:hypothetical protein
MCSVSAKKSLGSMLFMGIDIGFRNFSFHVIDDKPSVLHAQNIDLLESTEMLWKECKIDELEGLMRNVLQPALDPWLPVIAHVSIERQPEGKYSNVKMLVLSVLLQKWARDYQWQNNTIYTVSLVAASRKYRKSWMKRWAVVTKFAKSKALAHAQRKRNSVAIALGLMELYGITGHPLHVPGIKKKDDYADSFIIALLIWESEFPSRCRDGPEPEEEEPRPQSESRPAKKPKRAPKALAE